MTKHIFAVLGGWRRTAVNLSGVTANDRFISVFGYSAPVTITLPHPGTVLSGKEFVVKDDSGIANTHTISVVPEAGTIDGGANVQITTAFGAVILISDGISNYSVISERI